MPRGWRSRFSLNGEGQTDTDEGMNLTSLERKIFAFAVSFFIPCAVFAADPDLKTVKFTGQIISKSPYKLKFSAPKGHHFNQEAPAKVEVMNGEKAETGKIEKSLPVMTVEFPKETKIASACVVKASLFVCNDANTYCLPIKQDFDCQKLQVKN